MKLSDLLGTRTIDVNFGRNTISVTYDMGKRTPAKADELAAQPLVMDEIVYLVTAWDIEGADGAPVPLTVESVSEVPTPVLRGILRAVYGDDGLGEASSSSNAG